MSRPRRPQGPTTASDVLQVLDMGLDFRSYLSRVDENGQPLLGNVMTYNASKVADTFEPTVGLLVTLIHLFADSNSTSAAMTWLKTYDTIQKVFLEQPDVNPEAARYAREARELIASHLASGVVAGNKSLYERLLFLLDMQSNIRGPQAPSQRRIPREPKGAFCNLHLADHKCYQEFACNQFHLHEEGPVRHRITFFQSLAKVLLKEGKTRSEVLHRVKDSMFFARYGNKVTVRCRGIWIPFFKTVYTLGRFDQAFRREGYVCNDYTCEDENCRGIHSQDRRPPPSTKPMELHNPAQILEELDEEAEYIVSSVERQSAGPEIVPPGVTNSPEALPSPTTELWRNTVRDYVRQTGIPQTEADESLLRILQDTKINGTPLSSSERMTPLLEDLDTYMLDSSVSSSMTSEPPR